MNSTLPFFNWSLRKLLATESEVFNQARIRILFLIIVFALIKVSIVIITSVYYSQTFQIWRGLITLIVYLTFFKLLLANRKYVLPLTHLLIGSGIVLMWSIVFVSAQRINIVSLQFVFMVILCSFYLLETFWGMLYSLLAVIPVVLYIIIRNNAEVHLFEQPDELAFPGQISVICLNFVTFTLAHRLYRQAFQKNIDESKSLNVRLESALGEARKLAQSKADFLSTMSHELRTPLNMVIGMTELLRDSPHDKEQEENLRLLNFAAANLHTLINDILDFSKIDSGKLELEKLNINLAQLMTSICTGMEIQAREKGLHLKLSVDDQLHHTYVVADPTRISQIIYNLIGNGIKFTAKGEIDVNLTITEFKNDKIRVHFSVRDSGIGIPMEQQQLIFEPFVQASSQTTRTYGGTGLGLSIVKQLLAMYNSQIELESKPGEGSNFHFEIEFEVGNAAQKENIREESNRGDELHGLKLLVAEDNILNTFLIRKLCTKWQIEPVIVNNGREALQEIKQGDYELLLMDLHMPEMDGYTAAAEIRLLPNGGKENLIIIALSASVSGDLEDKIYASGMDDFVRKPFNAKELQGKLIAARQKLMHA